MQSTDNTKLTKPVKAIKPWRASSYYSGANRNRTDDLLLAKQALSQLSYGPVSTGGYLPLESLFKERTFCTGTEGIGMSGAINLEGRISYFILSDPDESRILASDHARIDHL